MEPPSQGRLTRSSEGKCRQHLHTEPGALTSAPRFPECNEPDPELTGVYGKVSQRGLDHACRKRQLKGRREPSFLPGCWVMNDEEGQVLAMVREGLQAF